MDVLNKHRRLFTADGTRRLKESARYSWRMVKMKGVLDEALSRRVDTAHLGVKLVQLLFVAFPVPSPKGREGSSRPSMTLWL